MKKNSKYTYLIFHPEHLVDLLRAGGRFSVEQSFTIPSPSSSENEIREFVEKRFPTLSEERYEVWLKFESPEYDSKLWFSLENIISAHFYSMHRQNAASKGVLISLNAYGIPVQEPLDRHIEHVLVVYDSIIRVHTASIINRAWFPEVKISDNFIDQLKLGYKYQQSPSPEKLPAIPSEYIWAHMVAYNPGLRKFDERQQVLWLQDIQEVIKRTDADFKKELKSIGEKHSSKFTDILDKAEKDRTNGVEPSNWILKGKGNENTYFSELDNYLSNLGTQQSFFYTALFYLNWRDSILNSDYSGALSDHKGVRYFLNDKLENPMRQAIAEALYTIVFAGGPRVFQKALIEARMKILGIHEPIVSRPPKTSSSPIQPPSKPKGSGLFEDFKKILGKIFSKSYDRSSASKKKELQNEIRAFGGNITKLKNGEFSYDQYIKLCLLFEIEVKQFDDYPLKAADNSIDLEDPSSTNQESNNSEVSSETNNDSPDNAEGQAVDSNKEETREASPNKKAETTEMNNDPSSNEEGKSEDADQHTEQKESASDSTGTDEVNQDSPNISKEKEGNSDLFETQQSSANELAGTADTNNDPSNNEEGQADNLNQSDKQQSAPNESAVKASMKDEPSSNEGGKHDVSDQTAIQMGSANEEEPTNDTKYNHLNKSETAEANPGDKNEEPSSPSAELEETKDNLSSPKKESAVDTEEGQTNTRKDSLNNPTIPIGMEVGQSTDQKEKIDQINKKETPEVTKKENEPLRGTSSSEKESKNQGNGKQTELPL